MTPTLTLILAEHRSPMSSLTNVVICLPVYHQDHKVKDCLESLFNNTQADDVSITVAIGINGANDELVDAINKYTSWPSAHSNINKVIIEDFGKNLGKGACVNRLVQIAATSETNYVVSMDSDLIVKGATWLSTLINAHCVSSRYEKVGGISADQEVSSCHLEKGYGVLVYDSITFRKYDGNNGVAGGLLLIPYKVWNQFGGYKAHNLYGSDDGHFGQDCAVNGMSVLLCKDVVVIHPPETNADYAQWKQRSVKNELHLEEKTGYRF